MSADEYRTLSGPGRAQTRVLGSRFLGHALSVSTSEEVSARLADERKQYHDATHICWAARLDGTNAPVESSSDAGEPHGTAGFPILREIQKRDLVGCLVLVTRYFGGTKLGRGNLARAYAECSSLALDAAPQVVRRRLAICRVRCPFQSQSVVYAVAHRFHAEVEVMTADGEAAFILRVSPQVLPVLQQALTDESGGRIRLESKP